MSYRWTVGIMTLTMVATILVVLGFSSKANDPIIGRFSKDKGVIKMPLVLDSDPSKAIYQSSLKEDRSPEYAKLLSASVKIRVSGASGSGTICYYDYQTNWAYVISCGHLWNGTSAFRNSSQGKAKIIVWYKNEVKLNSPKEYEAEVLFWSNNRGQDCSCLRFRPDWQPDYFPIAPVNYELRPGSTYNSCGCDGGDEVARYEVEFVEYRGSDLITRRNSPRPGRSGGGLISNDGWYIGICWGTSDTSSGSGIGYFTPLRSIHQVFSQNGHSWLLEVGQGGLAQRIPIQDWDNPRSQYKPDFIPLPRPSRVLYHRPL